MVFSRCDGLFTYGLCILFINEKKGVCYDKEKDS